MTLFGYDISDWQQGIDPAAVPGDFVIIKATGGTSFVNADCDRAYQAAKSAGKKLGVYHFAHEVGCQGSGADEARWFLANIQGYLGEALVILDWEGDNVTDTGWALEFKRVVESEGNVRCVVYGSTSQLGYVKALHDGDSPVWAAGYSIGYQQIDGYNPPQGPLGVPDGMAVSMWQFTSSGRLPGWNGNLDLNVFYGDGAAWDKLAARLDGAAAPQAPVSAPAPVIAPAPAPVAPAAPQGVSQCIVSAGDSMSAIAAQFNVNLGALIAANPQVGDPNTIYPGQVLNLPGHAVESVPAQVIIESGDTLSAVAEQFGVSLQQILNDNPSINPDLIYPGQVINL